MLHTYGKGLQRDSDGHAGQPPVCSVVLKQVGRALRAEVSTVRPRAPRINDSYLVYFRVPAEAPPGQYVVWVNNGFKGDRFGWVRGGDLVIVAHPTAVERLFRGTDYGVTGDGQSDDSTASTSAPPPPSPPSSKPSAAPTT